MLDITAMIGLFALVSSMLMQIVKPWVEKIPGIMLPQNTDAHDSLLRLVLYAINFALLIMAASSPSTPLTGLQWFDLLGIAFGQSILSHGNFTLQTSGKVDPPAPAPVTVTEVPPAA